MDGIKVAIGIPHTGDIEGYFFDTVLALSRPDNTQVIRVQDKPVDLARNMIVEAALADPDVTHLFFMDSDMQFHPDALFRLIQRDKPVIGGTYFARTENPIPHIYQFHHEDNEDGTCPVGQDDNPNHHVDRGRWYRPMAKELATFLKRHEEYKQEPGATVLPATVDSIVECDALGGGCLLIKREVLEAIPYPWFKCHDRSAGGEDCWFCDRVKEAGYGVWGDFSVQCHHEYRHVWMERNDFIRRFKVGEPDEHNFDAQIQIVDASPKDANTALRSESDAV